MSTMNTIIKEILYKIQSIPDPHDGFTYYDIAVELSRMRDVSVLEQALKVTAKVTSELAFTQAFNVIARSLSERNELDIQKVKAEVSKNKNVYCYIYALIIMGQIVGGDSGKNLLLEAMNKIQEIEQDFDRQYQNIKREDNHTDASVEDLKTLILIEERKLDHVKILADIAKAFYHLEEHLNSQLAFNIGLNIAQKLRDIDLMDYQDALYHLALAYAAVGNSESALHILETNECLDLFLEDIVEVFLIAGDIDGIELLKDHIIQKIGVDYYHTCLSLVLFKSGQIEKALQELQKITNPRELSSFLRRMFMFLEQLDIDKIEEIHAERFVDRALNLSSKFKNQNVSPLVYLAAAQFFVKIGKREKALQMLYLADKWTRKANVLILASSVAAQIGDKEYLWRLFDKVIALQNKYERDNAIRQIIHSLLQLRDTDGLKAFFNTIKNKEQDADVYAVALIETLKSLGRLEDEEGVLQAVDEIEQIKDAPYRIAASAAASFALWQIGHKEKAEQIIGKVLTKIRSLREKVKPGEYDDLEVKFIAFSEILRAIIWMEDYKSLRRVLSELSPANNYDVYLINATLREALAIIVEKHLADGSSEVGC